MNSNQSAEYQAGQAKGQVEVTNRSPSLDPLLILSKNYSIWLCYVKICYQEKGSQLMDQAGNAAQSAKESMQQVQLIT